MAIDANVLNAERLAKLNALLKAAAIPERHRQSLEREILRDGRKVSGNGAPQRKHERRSLAEDLLRGLDGTDPQLRRLVDSIV